MAREFSNSDDMIDVRDIIARIEELESPRVEADVADLIYSEEATELVGLRELMNDLAGNVGNEQWRGDWYPITLIRDSYFVEAMQELCEDIGDFPNGVPAYYVIDWEATAHNLRVDYSSVEFDGVTYWYR